MRLKGHRDQHFMIQTGGHATWPRKEPNEGRRTRQNPFLPIPMWMTWLKCGCHAGFMRCPAPSRIPSSIRVGVRVFVCVRVCLPEQQSSHSLNLSPLPIVPPAVSADEAQFSSPSAASDSSPFLLLPVVSLNCETES